MRDADQLSSAGDASQIRSGLETWFTLPDMPAPTATATEVEDGNRHVGGVAADGDRARVRFCAVCVCRF